MTDEKWMGRALALAERAGRTTAPNPAVGCVLVRGGQVVGEGWTRPPGGPHAEVVALADAGDRARGATAFVTLEPCDHQGRTGPCSVALIEAGVARVVAAVADPSAVAGGGAARLDAAGIDVTVGVRAREARSQNPAFFAAAGDAGMPLVTVKVAVSLDGRMAAGDGTSQWLTGQEARKAAHGLRAESDAVLVGSGTVLADDPRLTVRVDGLVDRQPLRVVLDGRARTRAGMRVYDSSAPSVAVVAPEADASALEGGGVEVWRVGGDRGSGESLRATLHELALRDVGRVLVEGGSAIAGAFVTAGLADRLVVHVAPLLLGVGGLPALDLAVATLGDAPRWRLEHVVQFGNDAVLTCIAEET